MRNIQEIIDGMRTFLMNTDRHDGDMLDATEVHAALNQFADELEALWKREKAEWESAACACVSDAVMSGKVAVEHKPVGNAAATREAPEATGLWHPNCGAFRLYEVEVTRIKIITQTATVQVKAVSTDDAMAIVGDRAANGLFDPETLEWTDKKDSVEHRDFLIRDAWEV